jgi:hypothetical protein
LTVPGTASTYEATDLDLIGDKKEEKKNLAVPGKLYVTIGKIRTTVEDVLKEIQLTVCWTI